MGVRTFLLLLTALLAQACLAEEELIASARQADGTVVPYVLNHRQLPPRYVLILFPGGNGLLDPRAEDGRLAYNFRGNFLLRARKFWVDDEFATAATNASPSAARIQAVIDDLRQRFPAAAIYLVGTSNGTFDTLELAGYLSDRIDREVHTSSLRRIADFDPRGLRNRHLIVHHRADGCHATPFSAAVASHDRYGTELIAIDGGTAAGHPCEPFGHHGFNGVEADTVEAIKRWIKAGATIAGDQR